jgi:hypothetical protein
MGHTPRLISRVVAVGAAPLLAAVALAGAVAAATPPPVAQQAQAGAAETDVNRAGAQRIRITGDWLAAGAGAVWLSGETQVYRFDARTGRRRATIRVPQGPCEASDVGFGALWTATCRQPGLTRIDQRTNRARHVRVPVSVDWGGEGSIGAGVGGIWLVADGARCTACRVVRVSPRTMRITARIRVRIGAAGVRTGEGSVWVTNPNEDVVQQIDPRRRRVVRIIPTGPQPRFFGVGEGAVWTLNQIDGSVTRIDARTGRRARIRTDVVGQGGDLTVGGGSVWARGSDRLLVRIDPDRRRVVKRYGPPSGSGAVTVAGGAVWISAHDVNTVWRLPLEDA